MILEYALLCIFAYKFLRVSTSGDPLVVALSQPSVFRTMLTSKTSE